MPSPKTSINHIVTLFPQPTDMTCWSAATTMLFGDRSIGAGSAQAGENGGLKSDFDNIQVFAQAHGLTMYAPQSWSVEGLIRLLRRGPFVMMGRMPNAHAVVVAGIQSDGSAAGTYLTIYDPWPPNVGKIQRGLRYDQLMQQFPLVSMYVLQR
ncbi:MAG: papain-like cysteine protease family protein [Saprospiraceae bacterium]